MSSLNISADHVMSHRCRILWPRRNSVWRMGSYPIRESVLTLKSAIESVGTSVNIMRCPEEYRGNLSVSVIEHDTPWMRDVSPMFAWKTEEDLPYSGIHWNHQGSGSSKDALIPSTLLMNEHIQVISCIGYELDPNMMITNGKGIFIISKNLFAAKNPNLDEKGLEVLLRRVTYIDKVIWVRGDFGGIDNVVNFIDENNVILNWTENKGDVLYDIFSNTASQLEKKGINVWRVSIPSERRRSPEEAMGTDVTGGERLMLGYASFFHGRDGIVIPQYGDHYIDEYARNLFENVLAMKKVVPVDGMEFALGGGSIRRITGCYYK